ncbi:serine aminopeptidase [Aureococcus anophagefferens]|nr:serine aminopeptidase [Aureococcus anophagefferens]
MLCSCYGDGEAEAPGSVLRSDWVRARLDYALAVERRRFVVVSSPQAEDASARGETSVEPTYVHVARVAYGRLLKAFIRPPRADYDVAQLGPRTFVFRATPPPRPRRRTSAAARSQLGLCLDLGCQFVALDCCGSGQSDGEYVSLGFKEQDDVAAVLAAERAAPGGVGDVVLWGRSMGAVTALLVASTREPDVKALVLDSAFASLRSLSLDVVRRGANGVPRVLAEAALRWIRGSVRERADFDIFDVDALRHAPECEAAAFFICAADDGFVEPSHSARLHDAVASAAKEMCVCPGAHNTTRPRQCYARVELFLRRVLFGEELADDARTLADDLDATLLPLISEPRRADRPNFAALAPWTVENLVIRAKQRLGQDDDDDGDDDPRPASAPRWLADAAEPAHDDTVAAMQEETARVAKLL